MVKEATYGDSEGEKERGVRHSGSALGIHVPFTWRGQGVSDAKKKKSLKPRFAATEKRVESRWTMSKVAKNDITAHRVSGITQVESLGSAERLSHRIYPSRDALWYRRVVLISLASRWGEYIEHATSGGE